MGLPMLACGAGASAYTHHVYAVWMDVQENRNWVMVAVSKDNGVTWGKPVMLSEQTGKKFAPSMLPSIAVNKAGVVGVCWYDTRDVPLDQVGWDLRFRASLDGGETWLPSVRVNSMMTLNLKPRRKRLHPETRFNNVSAGHTAGLAADASGVFHPLWIDNRTGTRQVWTATVTVASKP